MAIVPTVSMLEATIGIPFQLRSLLRNLYSRCRIDARPAGGLGPLGADEHVVEVEFGVVVDSHAHASPWRLEYSLDWNRNFVEPQWGRSWRLGLGAITRELPFLKENPRALGDRRDRPGAKGLRSH